MFSNLPPLELNNTGNFVPLPLNGQGGKVTIKIPAFALEDVGAYEIGIYNGDNDEPGYVASAEFAIAPYARFPLFDVPASLSNPALGMRLITHADLENQTYSLTPQWQGPSSSSNLMVSLGITVDALSAAVATVLGATTPTYEELGELVAGLELSRATLLQQIEANYSDAIATVDSRSSQNADDIAAQAQQLTTQAQAIATVDSRSSQNADDIAAQGQQLTTVDSRSSQNADDIAAQAQQLTTQAQQLTTQGQQLTTQGQQLTTVDSRSSQNADDIAAQAQQLTTVDSRSSQNADDIAAQAQQLITQAQAIATVDSRSSQNADDIAAFPPPFDRSDPGPIGQTTPAEGAFTQLSATRLNLEEVLTGVAQNSQANSSIFAIDGGLIDRFAFADRKGILTTTGVTSPENAVDKNSGTIAFLPNGGAGIFEFSFSPYVTYLQGLIYGVCQNIESYQISILAQSQTSPTWFNYPVVPVANSLIKISIPGLIYGHKVKLTFNSIPGVQGRVYTLGYAPQRPDITEQQHYIPQGSAYQIELLSPGLRVKNGNSIGAIVPSGIEATAPNGNKYRWGPDNSGAWVSIQI